MLKWLVKIWLPLWPVKKEPEPTTMIEVPRYGGTKVIPYLIGFLGSSREAKALPDRSIKLLLATMHVLTEQAYLCGYARAKAEKNEAAR